MSGSPGPECLAAAEKVRFLSLRQHFAQVADDAGTFVGTCTLPQHVP